MRKHSFPPVIDERARVLIMGSLPGDASLQVKEYYGNPRNYFWTVVYALFGDGALPDPDYDDRLAFAARHRLALWDVIAAGEREGSLDAKIKGETPNAIPELLAAYPGIRCLVFNGSKAHDTFMKHFRHHPCTEGRVLLKLPSTSPIPTPQMRGAADRIAAWRPIVDLARGASF
ncbi:DNA-deoxyinosine glycosylase [Paenibacillus xanthanilyticus]|uniref:DNA-deoxyinosine glycosylase n=1 Tax=Paenibacillus xanthanilyticus TaxID=1783531 RepID=A0ABV8JW98_9BACL